MGNMCEDITQLDRFEFTIAVLCFSASATRESRLEVILIAEVEVKFNPL